MCSLSAELGYVAVLFRFLIIQCVADRGVYREFSVLEGGGSKKGFGICNFIDAVWKWRSHQEDEWMSCRSM
jgi:hypothetical protein